jgi:hypothetical protein
VNKWAWVVCVVVACGEVYAQYAPQGGQVPGVLSAGRYLGEVPWGELVEVPAGFLMG